MASTLCTAARRVASKHPRFAVTPLVIACSPRPASAGTRIQIQLLGLLGLSLCLIAACASPELHRGDYPVTSALAPSQATALDLAIAPLEAAHPDASGFFLLDNGRAAFAARAQVTSEAQRSLDVQTYIWHADQTGKQLAYELLRAADRGVRVRLLLDDLDAREHNDPLLALSTHKNIEVRMFNPMASRHGTWGYLKSFASSFERLNHRMHAKSWIVDNRVQIAGGRNVGDEYFGASSQTNFADVELLMVGNVVRDGSVAFDRFWNSAIVVSMADLNPGSREPTSLASTRSVLEAANEQIKASRYADDLRNDETVKQLVRGDLALQWVTDYQLVADDPLKLTETGVLQQSAVLSALLPRMQNARHDLTIASPYFVPGKNGTELLVGLAQRGVNVKILTNSLAANDVAAVYGGYSRYRESLLKGGVQLWELKPRGSAPADFSLVGSSGASLHAKTLSIDDAAVFVGSYNLDLRSTSLNAEMGVYVDDVALASRFDDLFKHDTSGVLAWRVTLVNGAVSWTDGTETFNSAPHASTWRRFQAWLTRVLHVDPLL